jgi:hypothetical protein
VLGETERFSDQATQPVSNHGISGGFHRDRETQARQPRFVGLHTQRKEAIVDTTSGGVDRVELWLASQAQSGAEPQASGGGLHCGPYFIDYGTIFLRPLALRRERTFWPPAVFMRARNPVARLRLILLGW